MHSENRLKALAPALLAVPVCVIIIASMLMCPFEKPSSTAANDFGNIMNGGYIATDGSLSYYVDGSGALYCYSEYSSYRLSDGKCDSINPSGSYVYFRENGAVVRTLFTGGEHTVLADSSSHMLVSGNWLYYTDSDGHMYKRRLSGGRTHEVGITTERQFAVVGSYVYYIADDGYLYHARTDGSELTRFLAEQIDCFQVYGSFIYFLSEGRVSSVASANIASRKDYGGAEQFITSDDKLVTVVDGQLYCLDLTDSEAQTQLIEQQGDQPQGLCSDGECIYYYNADGQLIMSGFDGSSRKAV